MCASRQNPALAAYELLRREHPEYFRNSVEAGGIDIVDPDAAATDSGEGAGVFYSDPYIRVVRDAVRFPDGRRGTYVRILKASDGAACAVLPVLDGRVALLENYRHAIRSWVLEIPRGFGTDGLSAHENALKELREEICGEVASLTPIGSVHPDTGMQADAVPLFLARLESFGAVETSAGIRRVVLLTTDDVNRKIADGTLADGFTLAALIQARVRGLL
ncbi:NUDIX hydrolase [Streptomyces sp. NPDC058685]|uniref:NUDIX hydrolase n=1 Tax=Streptomyces sp. NPDC058685 TaxID=3346598 RepID=UPI003668B3F9